jgi:hypothetical protein
MSILRVERWEHLVTQGRGQGGVLPFLELSAASSEGGGWGQLSSEGVGSSQAMAEPVQQQQSADEVQEAIQGAGGVGKPYSNADWGRTLLGGVGAGGVGSGGYQYGEMAKLLEWERFQPPAHCNTSGLQQGSHLLQGTSSLIPDEAATLNLNAPLRSSVIAPALSGGFTGQERFPRGAHPSALHRQSPVGWPGERSSNRAYPGTQSRASHSNGLDIHQLEHLPRLQPRPSGIPLSGNRSSSPVSLPPRSHMPHPAAQVPAKALKQASSRYIPPRHAPFHPEAHSKRARIQPPQAEPTVAATIPVGAVSGLEAEEPMAGQAVDTAGVPGRRKELHTKGAGRSFPFKGSRPLIPQTRLGFVEDAAAQVRQAVPSPGRLAIWFKLSILVWSPGLVSQ